MQYDEQRELPVLLVVLRFDRQCQTAAEILAKSLQIPLLCSDEPTLADTDFELLLGSEGLSLRELASEPAQGRAKQRGKARESSQLKNSSQYT